MSGTIPLSLSQQFDKFGKPLANGRLYIIQAGTTNTPQTAYQDGALTIPYPGGSILTLDAAGRIGQFFLADGLIKVRLTDQNGIVQIEADGVQVIGPSSGGGGGGAVDPTTIMATGDVKYSYRTGVLAGFVRVNGRTIGSATSGATERANVDCQALFEYLWNADTSLVVSTGRGASANADWSANKTLTLPDFRGRVLLSPDGMGNTQAGRIGSGAGSFGVNNDTLGKAGGAETHTLTSQAQLPPHTHANTLIDPGHAHDLANSRQLTVVQGSSAVFVGVRLDGGYVPSEVPTRVSTTGLSISNASVGSSAAIDTMSPAIIVTTYMKL